MSRHRYMMENPVRGYGVYASGRGLAFAPTLYAARNKAIEISKKRKEIAEVRREGHDGRKDQTVALYYCGNPVKSTEALENALRLLRGAPVLG